MHLIDCTIGGGLRLGVSLELHHQNYCSQELLRRTHVSNAILKNGPTVDSPRSPPPVSPTMQIAGSLKQSVSD